MRPNATQQNNGKRAADHPSKTRLEQKMQTETRLDAGQGEWSTIPDPEDRSFWGTARRVIAGLKRSEEFSSKEVSDGLQAGAEGLAQAQRRGQSPTEFLSSLYEASQDEERDQCRGAALLSLHAGLRKALELQPEIESLSGETAASQIVYRMNIASCIKAAIAALADSCSRAT